MLGTSGATFAVGAGIYEGSTLTKGETRTGELMAEAENTVNDATMDAIRAKYKVLDLIIKNPQYDGKAVKAEAWEAFQEIRLLRHEVEELKVRSIGERNPGIDLEAVRRYRNLHRQAGET